MSVSIRRLREEDWQELRAIRLHALQSDPSVFRSNHEKESAMTEADWKGLLQTEDAAIFLLVDEVAPIGMTGIAVDRGDPRKKRAVLWGSWLEPRWRGRGLSHRMYQERLAWAQQHPTIETVVVSHRASNLRSQQAIQKHGFVMTHTVEQVWPDGTREESVFYTLTIQSARSPGNS
jgi:RimJ/RimL family protein N-acetyltransferase